MIGRPTYVRMVPVAEESCDAGFGQAVLFEQYSFSYYDDLRGYLISCALPQLGLLRYAGYGGLPHDYPAQNAVALSASDSKRRVDSLRRSKRSCVLGCELSRRPAVHAENTHSIRFRIPRLDTGRDPGRPGNGGAPACSSRE